MWNLYQDNKLIAPLLYSNEKAQDSVIEEILEALKILMRMSVLYLSLYKSNYHLEMQKFVKQCMEILFVLM